MELNYLSYGTKKFSEFVNLLILVKCMGVEINDINTLGDLERIYDQLCAMNWGHV